MTQGSAIDFIAVQTLDYKEQGKCRAGLEDDAPFAIAITAALMSTLVLPVNVERDESKKGSSALGADDVRYAAMGVISFIPLFNWLVCSFMKNIYFAVDTCFVSPTSFHALPSST